MTGAYKQNQKIKYGEGNFRALLQFRIYAGEEILASHIGICDKNASYISKTTQNEIIQCCGDAITGKIFAKIKNTKYFTIMADETTGISVKEQLAICIRYFDTTSYEIQGKFFKFFDVVDVSGENIARTILQELDRLNLDISYCRGQAYDGGSIMSGKFKGVQAHIAKVQSLAIYSHCANHRPNLAISKACSVANIRNAIGVISSVSNFFRESAGRIHKLETEVQDKLPHLKKGKHALKKMCETRWVEKHDVVLTFLDTLSCLPVVLGTISESSESRRSNVFSFLHATQSYEFLVSFWTNSGLGLEVTRIVHGCTGNNEALCLPSMDFIINELSSRFPKSELQRVGHIQKLLSPEFMCPTDYSKHSGALFSTLCRLKTYLGSTMTEDRLNGLALLHIHQDIVSALKPEEVLDISATKHKIKFSLNVL
ncbi:hypothetical protein PR048_007454 [Dryococelus australis]|uniref:DUF4371 domain-containing protein n=1 Tax=Dryococelus australis TaxID=614101 RepID=A0ABQ9HUA8_9NEOP|nr:hypothetical protein PR048_007454 [Dryococelus australis]